MTAPRPGDFIAAKCGRCNDITGHVIMIVLGGQIAKVECKACGSTHKYRKTHLPGAGEKEQGSIRHVRAGQERKQARNLGSKPKSSPAHTGTTSSGGAPRKNASAAKLESAWQEAMMRHSAETPLPYAMNGTYNVRDFLEHPVFGRGEIISISSGKIDVLFQKGIKILRCRL